MGNNPCWSLVAGLEHRMFVVTTSDSTIPPFDVEWTPSADTTHGPNVGSYFRATSKHIPKVDNDGLYLDRDEKQYAQLNSTLIGGKNVSIVSWFKMESRANWQRIIDFGKGTAQDNIVISPTRGNTNILRTDFRVASIHKGGLDSDQDISTNQWYQVGMIYQEKILLQLENVTKFRVSHVSNLSNRCLNIAEVKITDTAGNILVPSQISQSTQYGSSSTYGPNKAIDGNVDTFMHTVPGYNAYLQITLAQPTNILTIEITLRSGFIAPNYLSRVPTHLLIYDSNDGISRIDIDSSTWTQPTKILNDFNVIQEKLYINGNNVRSRDTAVEIQITRNKCFIGKSNFSNDPYYSGYIKSLNMGEGIVR